jgi:AAA family ATP:ADP antiporter
LAVESTPESPAFAGPAWLQQIITVRRDEIRPLAWSWLYLFSVFFAYYVIRPIRDEVGVASGVSNLPWLFTATLVAMIAINPPFAALVARLSRARFISIVYRFFMMNLLVFLLLFKSTAGDTNLWVGRVFFVWTSVFNLFVVSVFWQFMVDVFTSEQGKRLFGFLAAAATVGGILGSSVTATTVQTVGAPTLLLVSIVLLEVGVFCVRHLAQMPLVRPAPAQDRAVEPRTSDKIGGGIFAGLLHAVKSPYLLGICVYMLLYSCLSTFLYVQQAGIVDVTFANRAARTAFFARIDLIVNLLTLGAQVFLTSQLMKRLGIAVTLTLVPIATAVGFITLGIIPSLAIVVAFIVIRRAGNFAFARPSREVLFTVLTREDKYKAKSAIDTVVYRLGDQVGVWSSAWLTAAGLGLAGVAWTAVPLSLAWVATGWWLGRRHAASQTSEVRRHT